MDIKTTVGQVSLVDGGLQGPPGSILVDEQAGLFGRRRKRGSLYIVTDVTGPSMGRDIVTAQLAQLLRQVYFDRRGSMTAGLQQALREANALLLEENRQSLPGEHRTAGVSCAVLREDDLYIAQAGPAAVYLLHGEQVTRFPEESPWLDDVPSEDAQVAALGERLDLKIELFHSKVRLGDTVLLVNADLARKLRPGAWPELLSQASVRTVLEDLLAVSGELDLLALVVRMGDEQTRNVRIEPEVPKAAPAAYRRRDEPVQEEPGLQETVPAIPRQGVEPAREEIETVQVPPEAEEEVPVRARQRVTPDWEEPARMPSQPGGNESRPTIPQERARSVWEEVSARLAQLRLGERLQTLGKTLVATLVGLGAGLWALLRGFVPERTDRPSSRGRRSTAVKTAERKPKPRPKPRRAAGAGSDSVQKLLIGVAIAIPLIVAVIVVVTWLQRGQAQRGEIQALWEEANIHWQQAQIVSDDPTVRTHLTEAERFLGEYLERRPDDAEATDLQKRIQARLDVINQVKRISWVGELNSYPSTASLSRVVVQGTHVFVMDRQNGQVYHHQLDEQLQRTLDTNTLQTVLVSRGDQVGDAVVGDLVDMVWMTTGPDRLTASLVILESGGRLLDYDPATGQLVPLQVANSETWQYPRLVGSHSGRFYLLDSSANKIWRYDPTFDGYSNPPEDWLQTAVDLAAVVDMAIGDSIHLLYADGTMRKFSGGLPDTFDISDWDTPPSNPSAVFARPQEETRWVYLADRGNSRIVQASKEGQFRQQFRLADAQAIENGDALAGTTSLFVDEILGNAYLLSGQKLYLLILPMSD
ncbi:MAG: hypothetical protein P8189_00235 [Anaerolineae bacterium]